MRVSGGLVLITEGLFVMKFPVFQPSLHCRWKGENVSTTEVGNILTDLDFITDANVYGVTVPGNTSTC